MTTFQALVLDQQEGKLQASLQELTTDALPAGDVLVSVAYSSLNYKDGLAITGKGKIVRSFPMVPGVDFVGTVVESQSPAYKAGDAVVLTGWGVGERHWGGYAGMARVKADWLVPLPKGLTPQQAMGIGTAGFTAMMCVMALEAHGVKPDGPEVVVTGASGGVGSFAVALLGKLGYTVVGSTGRTENHDYLRELGASDFIGRDDLSAESKRPLDTQRWGGGVDTVGGATLAGLLRSLHYGGSVAACGLAGGSDLPTTVFPFILRGVNLLGIDSVMCPLEQRRAIWDRLQHDFPLDKLEAIMQEVSLKELPALAEDITNGKVRGRVVVAVQS
jgi:acrylyl-CoA reductase (NADPH)